MITDEQFNEKFKERFRKLVDGSGLSKTKCAKKVGISYDTLKSIYMTGKPAKMRTAAKIAKYFRVSVDYLACRTDKM